MALLYHLLQDYRWFTTIVVFIYVLSFSLSASQQVVITILDPWVTAPKSGRWPGYEQFNGLTERKYDRWETNFTTNQWKGVYTNLYIQTQDWYGGADWPGFYAASPPAANQPCTLRITKTNQRIKQPGVTYFGLWASAMQKRDAIRFFHKGHKIFETFMGPILEKLPTWYEEKKYWRNPHYTWNWYYDRGFAFVGFFFDTEYDQVEFLSEDGRFYSDNHVVGLWRPTQEMGREILRMAITPPPTTTT